MLSVPSLRCYEISKFYIIHWLIDWFRFRNGTANCVVATDVVDEGVDIPSCTLILRYDLPMDFRGYIQSKGRARDKAGKYVMLLSRRDHTYQSRHANFKRVEGFLKQVSYYLIDTDSWTQKKLFIDMFEMIWNFMMLHLEQTLNLNQHVSKTR